MKITIKKASKKDVPHIVELQKGLAEYHENITLTKDEKLYEEKNKNASLLFRKFLQKHINNKKSLVLIVCDNKKPIAYCLSFIKENTPIFKIKEYGLISYLYVEKNYRGKGLGKKLIGESKKFLKKNKIKFMELKVTHNNHQSIKFYQKYGFKEHYKEMRIRI